MTRAPRETGPAGNGRKSDESTSLPEFSSGSSLADGPEQNVLDRLLRNPSLGMPEMPGRFRRSSSPDAPGFAVQKAEKFLRRTAYRTDIRRFIRLVDVAADHAFPAPHPTWKLYQFSGHLWSVSSAETREPGPAFRRRPAAQQPKRVRPRGAFREVLSAGSGGHSCF